MHHVVTINASGEVEYPVSQRYSMKNAIADARQSAHAASRNGYTGRANVIGDDQYTVEYSIAVRSSKNGKITFTREMRGNRFGHRRTFFVN